MRRPQMRPATSKLARRFETWQATKPSRLAATCQARNCRVPMLASFGNRDLCGNIRKGLERVKGIEPSYSAWKAAALPLSYTRVATDHLSRRIGRLNLPWSGSEP